MVMKSDWPVLHVMARTFVQRASKFILRGLPFCNIVYVLFTGWKCKICLPKSQTLVMATTNGKGGEQAIKLARIRSKQSQEVEEGSRDTVS